MSAILANPELALVFDLTTDENGEPIFLRTSDDDEPEIRKDFMNHCRYYLEVCGSSTAHTRTNYEEGHC